MKKQLIIAALALAGMCSPALAQQHGDGEGRFEKMKTELNLTDDQATTIKAIFDKNHAKMDEVHADGQVTEDERKMMRETRQAMNKEIMAILTPDQQRKFKEMKERQRERRRESRPAKLDQ